MFLTSLSMFPIERLLSELNVDTIYCNLKKKFFTEFPICQSKICFKERIAVSSAT